MGRYFKDLRDYLARVEEMGKLVRIRRPVVRQTELMPIHRLQFLGLPEADRKILWFEDVRDVLGHRMPGSVVTGAYGLNREFYAIGMGCAWEEVRDRWVDAVRHPIPPTIVSDGPVQEVVVTGREVQAEGLALLAAPLEEPGFSGTLRTTTQIISEDPETGVRNVGMYGGHFRAKDRLLLGAAPTHHVMIHLQKCRRLGRPLPIAIVVGAVPALAYPASATLPYGVDELAVAGAIASEPLELVRCRTVDLEVPASAEIVIEGEVSPDCMEPQTAFGEIPGYMYEGTNDFRPVVRVTAITHRHDPIFTPILVGMNPSENAVLANVTLELNYYTFLRYQANCPFVREVAFSDYGPYNFAVVSIEKTHPSQPFQVLQAMTALAPDIGKIVVVVDHDIDPRDPEMVIWALSYSMQPHRDVQVIKGRVPMLDLSAFPPGSPRSERSFPKGEGSSALLINATRPWPYPPVGLPMKEYMERAIAIWNEEGLAPLTLKKRWYGYSLGDWPEEDQENARLQVEGNWLEMGARYEKRQTRWER